MTVQTSAGPKTFYKESRALVIAQSNYIHWERLPATALEAENIVNALRAEGIDADLVPNLAGAQLEKTIKDFLYANVNRDTRLVVYFAGHGWTDGQFTGYILPIDTPLEGDDGFKSALVSLEDIQNWSYASKAKHILFVFDSCFSGAVFLTRGGSVKPSPLFVDDADNDVRQFITSGNETDQVPARSDFAPKFVEGLRGAADTYPDGIVTANELGYWLKAVITPLGKQTPQYGSSPLGRWRSGDLLFLYPSTKPPALLPIAGRSSGTRGVKALGAAPSGIRGGWLYDGVLVYYYQKVADGRRVLDILDKAGVPYLTTRGPLSDAFPVSGLACGPDIPVAALKTVSLALMDGGVPLRAIMRFRDPESKRGRIELVALSENAEGNVPYSATPLTREQIESLKACPDFLHN